MDNFQHNVEIALQSVKESLQVSCFHNLMEKQSVIRVERALPEERVILATLLQSMLPEGYVVRYDSPRSVYIRVEMGKEIYTPQSYLEKIEKGYESFKENPLVCVGQEDVVTFLFIDHLKIDNLFSLLSTTESVLSQLILREIDLGNQR